MSQKYGCSDSEAVLRRVVSRCRRYVFLLRSSHKKIISEITGVRLQCECRTGVHPRQQHASRGHGRTSLIFRRSSGRLRCAVHPVLVLTRVARPNVRERLNVMRQVYIVVHVCSVVCIRYMPIAIAVHESSHVNCCFC